MGSPSQTTDPVQAPGFTNYKSGAVLNNALADLQTAITDAKSRSCDVTFAGDIDLGGLVLAPGVYCYAGAISVTGTLTLNGPCPWYMGAGIAHSRAKIDDVRLIRSLTANRSSLSSFT